ncbi:MAG: ATP-dependent nuclease subunit B, partial [Oscillospiraceae bacterium]|nr:ATP-dependent nuclease subunit B [Oscillospiraceae bacterium]
MLRLIVGKAGAGKTAAVMEEIRRAVEQRRGGVMLLVPEQYSHEAERELCRRCGDSLSLYAEVFSFTGLARRVMAQQGGGAADYLDKGGRLLCMALALGEVGSRLKIYGAARYKAELQAMLLRALDELKTACVGPETLARAAEACGGALGDKLQDLALVSAAYDAVVARGHADPADRLTVLAGQIGESGMGPQTQVYVDGFIDFTAQERAVLEAMLRRGVQLTVCLTLDGLESSDEIYALSRVAARRLLGQARELGEETRVERLEGDGKAEALRFFADKLFRYTADRFEGDGSPIRLHAAENVTAECEFAAARALELVREEGCRWRDIAVAVRGFEDYRGTLESVFRHYGVPLFTARRSELLSRPLPALISLCYEICDGGWEADDVISYMRTGLAGLEPEECDELADYIFKWSLRGSAWERKEDWRQHPAGYGAKYDEAAEERLRRINALRRTLAAPLLAFQRQSAEAGTAEGQAAALAELFRRLDLPGQLAARAALLEENGQAALAGEYRQLWELCVSALEQSAAILGDAEMDRSGFGRLFTLMLSQYDVGLIPVSLDRVSAGDFDRMRRRSIRHLIVLGCSDERLPQTQEAAGVFSDEERERLLALEIDLGGGESELWREFALIYNCLSLPSDSLDLCYARSGADGESLRPAYVYNRAGALFGLREQ